MKVTAEMEGEVIMEKDAVLNFKDQFPHYDSKIGDLSNTARKNSKSTDGSLNLEEMETSDTQEEILAMDAELSETDFQEEVNVDNLDSYDDGYWNENGVGLGMELDTESSELASTIRAVALHLEGTLRAAKKAHLSCGNILLPPQLLHHIAKDIIHLAESEPCGLRGCQILLSFESGSPISHHQNSTNNNNNAPATANILRIGKIKCDRNTVNTFELNLLLKEDLSPWYSRLPQILRNLAKGGTIVISPKYEISKKKLYRSHH